MGRVKNSKSETTGHTVTVDGKLFFLDNWSFQQFNQMLNDRRLYVFRDKRMIQPVTGLSAQISSRIKIHIGLLPNESLCFGELCCQSRFELLGYLTYDDIRVIEALLSKNNMRLADA